MVYPYIPFIFMPNDTVGHSVSGEYEPCVYTFHIWCNRSIENVKFIVTEVTYVDNNLIWYTFQNTITVCFISGKLNSISRLV